MEEVIIKCLVKLNRQIYPRNKISSGDFAIVSMGVEEVFEGEPHTSSYGTITVTGTFCELEEDAVYNLVAKEVENEKYGLQYQTISINKVVNLEDKQSQKIFLRHFLTERQVKNLYSIHDDPIQLLKDANIPELCKVNGVGVATANKMIAKYKDSVDYSSAYVKLDKLGLTTKMIRKLSDTYGGADILIDKIEENPYILADEINGIGWHKADELALKNNCGEYSVFRVKAFTKYFLTERANAGDTYVNPNDFTIALDDIIGLDLPQEIFDEAINQLLDENVIYISNDGERMALRKYYYLELDIAKELIRLKKAKNNFNYNGWEDKIKELEEKQGWEYTDEQREGIKTGLENNVVIIQGFAGTGKSTVVKGIFKVLNKRYSIAQCALSGKASVNLTEVTGEEGSTIHRLLGYNPSFGFAYNHKNKLDYDVIVLDEGSMPSADVYYKLLQAIKTGAKLFILGDTGQLESIGCGNVMQDIIDSEIIPVVTLTKIHRQAQKSAIITNSLDIYIGKQIMNKLSEETHEVRGELQDLELDIISGQSQTFNKIINYFEELYPTVDSIMDIQVIVPVKERGNACVYNINIAIQELLMDKNKQNTKSKGITRRNNKFSLDHSITLKEGTNHPYTLFIGDKVINTKNNYNLVSMDTNKIGIFNGDMGVITDINPSDGTITVDFQTVGNVLIPKNHLSYIELAYACTCHKAQGSGFQIVICGLDYSHYTMLTRQMVYTMLTRAKKYCVLVAENKALWSAIRTNKVIDKTTFLPEFLILKDKEVSNEESANINPIKKIKQKILNMVDIDTQCSNIYTSYFAQITKVIGTPISIARSTPDWVGDIENMIDLAPSSQLLKDYKDNIITWEEYTRRYYNELADNSNAMLCIQELIQRNKNEDITLYCWEKDGNCHRHLIATLLSYFNINVTEIPID